MATRIKIQTNQSAIDQEIRLANAEMITIENLRAATEKLTGKVSKDDVIGETMVYNFLQDPSHPFAQADWVAESMGKGSLFQNWKIIKAQVRRPFRYSLNDDGNVCLANKWLDELDEQHSSFIEGENIIIWYELQALKKAMQKCLDKTGLLGARFIYVNNANEFEVSSQFFINHIALQAHHEREIIRSKKQASAEQEIQDSKPKKPIFKI